MRRAFFKREPLYARRRGEKPPPARRVILRAARMAGFPLPHEILFHQLETKFVNLIPQASARRGTRELNLSKKEKRCFFLFANNFARPKAAPFGKRTPFAAYLRLLQER